MLVSGASVAATRPMAVSAHALIAVSDRLARCWFLVLSAATLFAHLDAAISYDPPYGPSSNYNLDSAIAMSDNAYTTAEKDNGEVCPLPAVGALHDYTGCARTTRCEACFVTCKSGYNGDPSLLRCLGRDSPLRNLSTVNTSASCDASASSDPVSLVFDSRCGLNECCPPASIKGANCKDSVDELHKTQNQCQVFLSQGYTCERDFCPSCGFMAGLCDLTCSYGDCDSAGDCFRGSRLSLTGPERCDDGNTVSGDGCSQDGNVESGFTCNADPRGAGWPDVCDGCADEDGWLDAQGFSCSDYAMLGACDATTLPTDPVLPGARFAYTPVYHQYVFMYDLEVTSAKALIVNISVKAAHDAHIFLGKVGGTGFEIVLGGWENGKSVLRVMPYKQEVSHYYGSKLNATEARHFWLYYNYTGFMTIGEGTTLFEKQFLGGTGMPTKDAQTNWGGAPLTELSVATGWGASGEWDVRLSSGSLFPTIAELQVTGKSSATTACCACGGGHRGRACTLEDLSIAGAKQYPRTEATPTEWPMSGPLNPDGSESSPYGFRRLSDHSIDSLMFMGDPAANGFKIRIAYTHNGASSCKFNAIVVPAGLGSNVQPPLGKVWPQVRSESCRLKDVQCSAVGRTVLLAQGGSKVLPPEYDWVATHCQMTPGNSYTAFVHIEPGSSIDSLTFTIPLPPTETPRDLKFVDTDPHPLSLTGKVDLLAPLNETGILQYRFYWGRDNQTKIATADPNQAIIGQVNTYSGGGLRNDFSNGCLYNDCNWMMETMWTHRRRSHYRIRHNKTQECFCQGKSNKALITVPCEDAMLQNYSIEAETVFVLQWYGDCIWQLEELVVNSHIEARLVNAMFWECLCQVPTSAGLSETGEVLPPLIGEASVETLIGKWCQKDSFSYRINNENAKTKGYCEWTHRPVDPTKSSHVKANVDADTSLSSFSNIGAASTTWGGVTGWHFSGASALIPGNHIPIGKDHAFAAWVRLQRLPAAHIVQGRRSLFAARSASGNQEACLLFQQRSPLDDRTGHCPLPVCNSTEVIDLCCSIDPNSTTTTTTSGTSTSTTTIITTTVETTLVPTTTMLVDNTSDAANSTTTQAPAPPPPVYIDPYAVCGTCACPSDEDANFTDTATERFALGLEACSSEVIWDSGYHFDVPESSDTGWMFVSSVGKGEADGFGETTFYASKPVEPLSLSYNASFQCADPGCVATGVVRDTPRDQTRTCALNVGVYVTDYQNGPNHAAPQVVEYITIRGGSPRRYRQIRKNCHPHGSADHNTLFLCVVAHNVDDLVGGPTASRSLEVELKISDAVTSNPKDGQLLIGVAEIVCKRILHPDRHAPESGTLHRVGVTGRTCAGASLESIGGDPSLLETGLGVHISQAWLFDKALTQKEMLSLYHGTRTRYFQDYQVELGDGVASNMHESRAVATLRCSFSGCEAMNTLKGLPTTHEATCLLTAAIAITDFSNTLEVVEYIKLDGQIVVTNCQIGQDGDNAAGSSIRRYNCADKLDVSMPILRSAYLEDGEVEVRIKISTEVDMHRTSLGYLLDAEVTMLCSGQGSGYPGAYTGTKEEQIEGQKYDTAAIHFVPQTSHFLAVSSNLEGESGMRPDRLVDRCNGFVKKPFMVGEPSMTSVMINFQSIDPNGVIFLYAVERYRVPAVVIPDVISGAVSQYDICPGSHRRRGYQLIQEWWKDPVMTNCEFEPGVPYSIAAYVDRAELPHQGGTLDFVDIVGSPSTDFSGRPVLKARKIEFEDLNVNAKRLSGVITITGAYSEAQITKYNLYWGKGDAHLPHSGPVLIKEIPATGAYQYFHTFVDQDPAPYATHLIVYTANDRNSRVVKNGLIKDTSIRFLTTNELSESPGNQEMDRFRIYMQLTSSDAKVDVALVRKGAETKAKFLENQRGLDYDSIQGEMICYRSFQSSTANIQFDFGPCSIVPNVEYTVIAFASIRTECPCVLPCVCTGDLQLGVAMRSGSSLYHTATGFMQPDMVPPTATFEFFESDAKDRSLTLNILAEDPGRSFPVLAVCAACLPAIEDPNNQPALNIIYPDVSPAMCMRPGDEDVHRFWRINWQGSTACGAITEMTTVIDFVEISDLESYGEKVTDGIRQYHTDFYSLDLGSRKASIIRAEFHWTMNQQCTPINTGVVLPVMLDWSDDGQTWTTKIVTTISPLDKGKTKSHIAPHVSSPTWRNGTYYRTVFNGEGRRTHDFHGLTPSTVYDTHCYISDNRGNDKMLTAISNLKTTDHMGPKMWIQGFQDVSDFSATMVLKMRDPGKSYPGLSRCVAREHKPGLNFPTLSSVSGKGSLCVARVYDPQFPLSAVPAAPDNEGRIPYHLTIEAWLTEETETVRIEQRAWGGAEGSERKELKSCGLRQMGMSGPGGCGTMVPSRKQPAQFTVAIKAHRDAFLFIGGGKRGDIGYELIFGGWSNTKTVLRKGYSADPQNVDLPYASIVAFWREPKDMLSPDIWRHFWVSVDPNTGRIQIGRGEIFFYQQIMEYVDAEPIEAVDQVWVGAGHHSGGGDGKFGVEFLVCPRIGNILQHQIATSQSVSFAATPEKAVDGLANHGIMCEYCRADDTTNVCAQTRRGDKFKVPWIRVDFGTQYQIGSVRIVGAAFGDGRPEQSIVSVYLGNIGSYRKTTCVDQVDIRGTNVFPCNIERWGIPGGRFLSVYGWADILSPLPSYIGIRVCEVQAFQYFFEDSYLYKTYTLYDRVTGVPAKLTPGDTWQKMNFTGLMPNTTYEVFCYGEDSGGFGSLSEPAIVTTTDFVPPKVNIDLITPKDFEVVVQFRLDDPGKSYPALGRCAATLNGQTPQEHERFFQHRFWRAILTKATDYIMPPACDKFYIRAATIHASDGAMIPGFTWSSGGPESRGPALTTDDFSYNEQPELSTMAWALDFGSSAQPAYLAWDLLHMYEMEELIMKKGGSTYGDVVIAFLWNNSVNLQLFVETPEGLTIWHDDRKLGGGVMDIVCDDWTQCDFDNLESVSFAVAKPGTYMAYIGRPPDFDPEERLEEPAKAWVKVCGQTHEINIDLNVTWGNINVTIGQFEVLQEGCSRASHDQTGARKSWQSSTYGTPAPTKENPNPIGNISSYAIDGDYATCSETGGPGRSPGDTAPWWRMDLGRTARVAAIWVAGKGPVAGAATSVDVYVSDGNATMASQGSLCAKNVPIGSKMNEESPLRAINCVRGIFGENVWIVPSGLPDNVAWLSLCEVEVFTLPLTVASMFRVQWTGAPNSSDYEVCGAGKVTMQYSDDNVSWATAYEFETLPFVYKFGLTVPEAVQVQSGYWPWWSRMFDLQFISIFETAGVQPISIPHLRQNTTYDIFCWATDSAGNDISRELVELILPWGQLTGQGQTTADYQPGSRRLNGINLSPISEGGRLECTPAVQEHLPCEVRVVLTDNEPPKIISAALKRAERLPGFWRNTDTGDNYVAHWELGMSDSSCIDRLMGNVKCLVRCEIVESGKVLQNWKINGTCNAPSCAQERWSNELTTTIEFQFLRGDAKYKVLCEVGDPWGNNFTQQFDFEMPGITTTTRSPSPSPLPRPGQHSPRPRPSPRPRSEDDWRYAPAPTPEEDEAAGWVAMGEVTTTEVKRSWIDHGDKYGTQRPWVDPKDRTTTTLAPAPAPPTTTQTLGPTPPPPPTQPPVASGSLPVYTALTLGASSEYEARMLVRPAGVSALLIAVRESLDLNIDDVVSLHSVSVVAPPGRRLSAGTWQIRFTLLLQTVGTAHAEAVKNRVQFFSSDASAVTQRFKAVYSEELTKRSMVMNVAVVGASVLASAPMTGAGVGAAGVATVDTSASGVIDAAETGGQGPDGDGSNVAVIVVIAVSVAIVLLCCLPLCTVCVQRMYRLTPARHRETDEVADMPVKKSRAAIAEARSKSAERHTKKDRHRSSTKYPDPINKAPLSARSSISSRSRTSMPLSSRTAASDAKIAPAPQAITDGMSADDVPLKIAWGLSNMEERTATPDSGDTRSTTTGGDSLSCAAMGSSHSGRPLRRSTSQISATPQPQQENSAPQAICDSQSSTAMPHCRSVGEDDNMEVQSLNSSVACAQASGVSPLRLAALRVAQQPPGQPESQSSEDRGSRSHSSAAASTGHAVAHEQPSSVLAARSNLGVYSSRTAGNLIPTSRNDRSSSASLRASATASRGDRSSSATRHHPVASHRTDRSSSATRVSAVTARSDRTSSATRSSAVSSGSTSASHARYPAGGSRSNSRLLS